MKFLKKLKCFGEKVVLNNRHIYRKGVSKMRCAKCHMRMSVENEVAEGTFVYVWYCCRVCHHSFLVKIPLRQDAGIIL